MQLLRNTHIRIGHNGAPVRSAKDKQDAKESGRVKLSRCKGTDESQRGLHVGWT